MVVNCVLKHFKQSEGPLKRFTITDGFIVPKTLAKRSSDITLNNTDRHAREKQDIMCNKTGSVEGGENDGNKKIIKQTQEFLGCKGR